MAQIREATLPTAQDENLHIQKLRQSAEQDQTYQALKSVITEGFPNTKESLPAPLKKFWSVKDYHSIDDDLIVYGCRLLIPASLRPTMLSRLHEAHQGVAPSQARASLTIYWPGMHQDIQAFFQAQEEQGQFPRMMQTCKC